PIKKPGDRSRHARLRSTCAGTQDQPWQVTMAAKRPDLRRSDDMCGCGPRVLDLEPTVASRHGREAAGLATAPGHVRLRFICAGPSSPTVASRGRVSGRLVTAAQGLTSNPRTVKGTELVALPAGVVTLIGPVVALGGTVALICVSEVTVKEAGVPLKATAVVPVKRAPLVVTLVPPRPPVGGMCPIGPIPHPPHTRQRATSYPY